MIDVIIPTYRPGRELIDILNILSRQTLPPNKIILINTEERYLTELFDGMGYIPDKDKTEIHNITADEFDHGGTRNAAAGYSKADILVYMTQDAVPENEDFIRLLTAPLSDKDTAISYARQLPKDGCSVTERITREFNYPDTSLCKSKTDLGRLGIKTYFCSNVSCAYRRDVFDRLGGFVSRTIFNEDMIYAAAVIEAGYRIAYTAEARVFHSHNYGAKEQFRRNVDIGVSQAEHPEVFAGLSSESEGKRLVMTTIGALAGTGHILRIPSYIWTVICRYAGYLIGKNHKRLPRGFVKSCSMNPGYFG